VHGIVFEELREYVWKTDGAEAWTQLLQQAVPGRRFYGPDSGYPDEELEALLAGLSTKAGVGRNELLRGFGKFVAPTLLDLYRPLLQPEWDLFDLLEHVEETIHRVVRLDDPAALPPSLRIDRAAKERVVVHYDSERKMCFFAKGIIDGLQAEYSQDVAITTSRACTAATPNARSRSRSPADARRYLLCCGSRSSAHELMQKRLPVGPGPSSKT
jgi:hypothetical protein